jgi:integrase
MAGFIYKPSYTDRHGKKRESRVWWLGYTSGRRRVRESSGTTVKADAEVLLARKIASGRPSGPLPSESGLVRFADLVQLLLEDYRRKGNRTSPAHRVRHLERYFGTMRPADISEPEVDRYIGARLGAGAAPATINRELAALRRMMRLGVRARYVADVPSFSMLGESVREGFVTEEGFGRLLDELPAHLKPLIEALYVCGWRVQDMLSRDWADVDLDAGWIRIEGSDTKEKSGRQLPLLPRLRAVLEGQRERADALEGAGHPVQAVFFYHERTRGGRAAGERIHSFRGSWRSACQRAGLDGLRVHDLRRSAARHLIRAGVSEHVAMKFTGHKTQSIFRRYDIVAESDLIEGGEKLNAFYTAQGLRKDKARSGGAKKP